MKSILPEALVRERVAKMKALDRKQGRQEKDEWSKKLLIAESLMDPVLFAAVWLNTYLWGLQATIARTVPTKATTAVKACHASGKTKLAAVLALWWLARYPRSSVVTTAPTDLQVRKLLWGEIHSGVLESRYPFPKPNQLELKMGPKRYALGLATSVTENNKGVKFQGFHEDNMLIIVDEAPGVNVGIWEAIEGIRAGGHVSVLYLGNPTIPSGSFYDLFTKENKGVAKFTISAFDTPNLKGLTLPDLSALEEQAPDSLDINPRSYLTTKRWVLEMSRSWGIDNPLYQARVLGQFPSHSEHSLLSMQWLMEAKLREGESGKGKVCIGADISGPGEAESALIVREGGHIIENEAHAGEDCFGWMCAVVDKYIGRIERFNVDSAGIGFHMLTQFRKRYGRMCQGVNVGSATSDNTKYLNLKAELYWGLRDRFQAGQVSGLMDEKTQAQLAGLRWNTDDKGRIYIERKEDARKRGVDSPDRAEALMLAYSKPVVMGGGIMDFYQGLAEMTNEEKVNRT